MMEITTVEMLDAYIEKAQTLSKILKDSPEIIRFMELEQGAAYAQKIIVPLKMDKLITVRAAAEILGVNPSRIYRYIQSGILKPRKTPESDRKKFWLSEVMAIAGKD